MKLLKTDCFNPFQRGMIPWYKKLPVSGWGCPGVTTPGCLFTPARQRCAVPITLSLALPVQPAHPTARMESHHTVKLSSVCFRAPEMKTFSTQSRAASLPPLDCSQVCFFSPHPSLERTATQPALLPSKPSSLLPMGDPLRFPLCL